MAAGFKSANSKDKDPAVISPKDSVSVHDGEGYMDMDSADEAGSTRHSPALRDIDLDDPFAYDSELETLSSVSSHSSISSSGSSVLDHPIDFLNECKDGNESETNSSVAEGAEVLITRRRSTNTPESGSRANSDIGSGINEDTFNISSVYRRPRSSSKRKQSDSDESSENEGCDEEESDRNPSPSPKMPKVGSGKGHLSTKSSRRAPNSRSSVCPAAGGDASSADEGGLDENSEKSSDTNSTKQHETREKRGVSAYSQSSKASDSHSEDKERADTDTDKSNNKTKRPYANRRKSKSISSVRSGSKVTKASNNGNIAGNDTDDSGSEDTGADSIGIDLSTAGFGSSNTKTRSRSFNQTESKGFDEDESTHSDGADAEKDTDDVKGDGNEEEEVEKEDAAAREARRAEALIELTNIEVEFAKLRERLYSERLQQVQIEEDYLVSGMHTEYTSNESKISAKYEEQLRKLRIAHEVWLTHQKKQHESWVRSVNYTHLVQRQELRTRLLEQQQRKMWRLRDIRVQEDRKYSERMHTASEAKPGGVNVYSGSLFSQQQYAGAITQMCMAQRKQGQVLTSRLNYEEMDADYRAMCLPVYPREPKPTAHNRRIFVPPFIPDGSTQARTPAGRKRKPRQPKRKKNEHDGNSGQMQSPVNNKTTTAGARGNAKVKANVGGATNATKTPSKKKAKAMAANSTASGNGNVQNRRVQKQTVQKQQQQQQIQTALATSPHYQEPQGNMWQQSMANNRIVSPTKQRTSGVMPIHKGQYQQQQQQQKQGWAKVAIAPAVPLVAKRVNNNGSANKRKKGVGAAVAAVVAPGQLQSDGPSDNSNNVDAQMHQEQLPGQVQEPIELTPKVAAADGGEGQQQNENVGGSEESTGSNEGRSSVDIRVPASSGGALGLKV